MKKNLNGLAPSAEIFQYDLLEQVERKSVLRKKDVRTAAAMRIVSRSLISVCGTRLWLGLP
jgi:hypothetical protein